MSDINNDKEVNIQKFDQSDFSQESCNFTQLSNTVIQNIQNSFAYHVWSYLQSKPPTWIPNRQELINHFRMSEERISKILNFLKASNLLLTKQLRNKDGSMGKYQIKVLSGANFIVIECPKMRESKQTTAPPLTAPPVNRPPAYADHINKEYINKNTEIKNTTTTVAELVEDNSSSISCKSNNHEDELRKLGFCNADIYELNNIYMNDLSKLHQSVDHLVFDADVNNRADTIDIKLEYWFMKIMRKGNGFNAPAGYHKRNPKNLENPKKPEIDKNKKIYLDNFYEEKTKWFMSLSQDQRFKLGLTGYANCYDVQHYFEENIWPALFDKLKND